VTLQKTTLSNHKALLVFITFFSRRFCDWDLVGFIFSWVNPNGQTDLWDIINSDFTIWVCEYAPEMGT
jgi:hypothetical protein